MARINLDDFWFGDHRRITLAAKLNESRNYPLQDALAIADSAAIMAWRLAAKHYLERRDGTVPADRFRSLSFAQELIDCDLAQDVGDRVLIRGAKDRLGYIGQKQDAGKRSGEKRATGVNERSTSVQPRSTGANGSEPLVLVLPLSQSEKIQSCANPDENTQSGAEPSGSLDVLNQFDKNHESQEACNGFDLEAIYQAYPRRLGSQAKAQGMARLKKLVTSEEKRLAILEGVEQYARECLATGKTGTSYVKTFGAFFGNQGPWKEYANAEVEEVNQPQSSTTRQTAYEYGLGKGEA